MISRVLALAVVGAAILFSVEPLRATADDRAAGYDQRTPAASFLGDRYFLAWAEDRGAGSDIYGKFLLANGRAVGGATRSGRQVIRGTAEARLGPRFDPYLVVVPRGLAGDARLLLFWTEVRSEASGHDVYGVQVSPAGMSIGSPRMVAGGPGDQRRPHAVDSGSGLLLVWDDNSRDNTEIWGGYFTATRLSPQGAVFPIVQGPGSAESAQVPLFASRDYGWT